MPLPTRKNPIKKILYWLSTILIVAIIVGCGDRKIPGVYRIDIQQGNVVTQEMLEKLEKGMDKRKVRFILGTPLIVSAFDQDRWDYVYTFQSGGKQQEQRRISLFFEEGKLHHIKGDIVKAVKKDQLPEKNTASNQDTNNGFLQLWVDRELSWK